MFDSGPHVTIRTMYIWSGVSLYLEISLLMNIQTLFTILTFPIS